MAPNGKIRWQRWTDHALFDANGELQQYQSIGLDITESKVTEQALRESEERFRELAELMPETIFEMTLDGTLTYVNRNAYNYFGYTRADLKNGLNSLDVLIPRDRQRAMAISEVIEHLRSAGFARVEAYNDFEGSPATEEGFCVFSCTA